MVKLIRSLKSWCFWQDTQGVTWIYVTITASVLFGFAALVIDFTRYEITHSQARAAAEASALSGATQLNGAFDSITRSCNAVISPLVDNAQQLGATPGNITISRLRFLSGLPAGDPTLPEDPSVLDSFVVYDTDPAGCTSGIPASAPYEARFIEVTTQQIDVNSPFVPVTGGSPSAATSASAVAGFTQVLCRRAPLAICNPAEAVGQPPITDASWVGRQILIKGKSGSSGSSAYVPGDFALVDIEGVQSTPEIWRALAEDEPPVCIEAKVNLKPGQVQGARSALNTRFGMYDPPMFGGGSEWTQAKYRPSKNVTKGKVVDSADTCTFLDPPVGAASMSFPKDDQGQTVAGVSNNPGDGLDVTYRFGNGKWNCREYWNTMHPADPIAAGGTKDIPVYDPNTGDVDTRLPPGTTRDCGDAANTTTSRYDVYRDEIKKGIIPNTYDATNPTMGENGNASAAPQCYSGGSGTITDQLDDLTTYIVDRRLVYFAVLNCQALIAAGYQLTGNAGGVLPPFAYVEGLLTEPVSDPSSGAEIYLEITQVIPAGNENGVLHDVVQLYR